MLMLSMMYSGRGSRKMNLRGKRKGWDRERLLRDGCEAKRTAQRRNVRACTHLDSYFFTAAASGPESFALVYSSSFDLYGALETILPAALG